jgi:hypothetical protein
MTSFSKLPHAEKLNVTNILLVVLLLSKEQRQGVSSLAWGFIKVYR